MPQCNHAHGHSHSHAPSNFNRAFKAAIFINFAYVLIQIFFAFRANSNSLFADAGHNLGDVLGLIFAYVSSILHEKQASRKYSYGLKKTTILASMTNALILVFTCGVIGYDSIIKLLDPSQVDATNVMIVAAIGILLNGGSALFFIRGNHDLNIKGAFLHLAYDALISLGVVIGAGIIYFTHWYWLDPILGLAIVGMVLSGTLSLLKSSVRLVMDGVPPSLDPQEIQAHILKKPYVSGIHDLHIWALSTKENILTAHVILKLKKASDSPKPSYYDECLNDLRTSIESHFSIHHVTLQLEESDCEKSC